MLINDCDKKGGIYTDPVDINFMGMSPLETTQTVFSVQQDGSSLITLRVVLDLLATVLIHLQLIVFIILRQSMIKVSL